jgi:hypothetical protein
VEVVGVACGPTEFILSRLRLASKKGGVEAWAEYAPCTKPVRRKLKLWWDNGRRYGRTSQAGATVEAKPPWG